MQIQFTDYNNAAQVIAGPCAGQWNDLHEVITAMPLHLKASDQNRIQGRPIFDPVGTNRRLADHLVPRGWQRGIVIPPEFTFLGTDVDFGKDGVIVEAQFSNYPFLLNNVLRSELFFRAGTVFHQTATRLVIIVTKAAMFPSSNSTLYYEQAQNQLAAFAQHGVFTIPMRLVGLFENRGSVETTWTQYTAARYSRTVVAQEQRRFVISAGRGGRCRIEPEINADDL